MSKPSIELKMMKVADLLPMVRNHKVHTPVQIEQLKASIKEFGFCDPIGVTDALRIVEGEGRLMAAKEMGVEEVPVLLLTGMTPEEARAYAIAHNQTQRNSPLDMGVIGAEFNRLGVQDAELTTIGFTKDDALFLQPDNQLALAGGEGAEEGGRYASGQDRQSWSDYIPPVHKAVLDFETEEDQQAFYDLITKMRLRYPNAGSIGERLIRMIEDFDSWEEFSMEAAQ